MTSIKEEKNNLPLVSIVMASYNKSAYIGESIASVLEQTYSNFELLVIDDASTDNTTGIIKKFNDERIKFEGLNVNRGANYCRNIGINKARGKYLMFLDADDILRNTCLQTRVNAALNNSESQLLIFSMGVFHNKVGDDRRRWDPHSKNPLRDFLAHKLPWSILQPFWKRSLLHELKGFDESMSRLQDVDLNTRALLHPNLIFRQLPGEIDCYYRIEESRKTFSAIDMLTRYIDSGIIYFVKFRQPAKTILKAGNPLAGTIYQLQQMIFQQRQLNNISRQEESQLIVKLLNQNVASGLGVFRIAILSFARRINSFPFRIPGVNWALRNLIIL